MLNNENTWTQEREHHTSGPLGGWGTRGGIAGVSGDWEGIALGETPNVDDGGMDAANHHGTCILHKKPVRVPQNLKYSPERQV